MDYCFFHGLKMRKWLSYFSCRCSWHWLLETLYIVSQKNIPPMACYNFGTYEHNNKTTVLRPFVQGYPGEPAPEETLTHPPSWSSSNLYQLLPSTTIHSILAVQITKQDYSQSKVERFLRHGVYYCYLMLSPVIREIWKTLCNRYLWLCVVTVAGFGYGYGIWIAGLG